MSKISKEVAQQEFNKWAEAKKISDTKRESNKDCEEEILNAIMEGHLTLTEENEWKYKLKFHLGKGEMNIVNELTFKLRLTINELNSVSKGLKPSDVEGKLIAYLSAITGESIGLLKTLDTVDYSTVSCIVAYFL